MAVPLGVLAANPLILGQSGVDLVPVKRIMLFITTVNKEVGHRGCFRR